MYKLLIVEDEPLIRAGMKHYFAWEELGITSLSEAENGRAGIEIALQEHPDLIITDIRMPEINGMDMIEQLRDRLPDTVFIILTGYNEFAYAQQALRLGVVHDFLIKPLIYEESLKTIVSCLDKLKARREEKERRSRLEKAAQEHKLMLGSQLVKRVLEDSSSVTEEELRDACGFAGESDRYSYQPFVIAAIPHFLPLSLNRSSLRKTLECLAASVSNTLCGSARQRKVLLRFDKNKLYALAVSDNGDRAPIPPAIASRLEAQLRDAAYGLPYTLYCSAGMPLNDTLAIEGEFQRTEKALLRRFFQSDACVFTVTVNSSALPPTAAVPKERHFALEETDKQRLLRSLENGDFAGTTELMHRLANEARDKSPSASADRFLAYIQELVSLALRFAHKHEIPVNGVYSDKVLTLAFVDDFPSIGALFDWLAEWMNQLSEVLSERNRANGNSDNRIFEKIEKFIQANIDQDITLQMVADRYFYNPSYLSRLFKTKLNKNYMTFVTELRIEYAKQCLLQPKLSVADICAKCGYKSYKHFVQTFKRMTNLSPTDYRNQLRL